MDRLIQIARTLNAVNSPRHAPSQYENIKHTERAHGVACVPKLMPKPLCHVGLSLEGKMKAETMLV
jgi:hypothetical protein